MMKNTPFTCPGESLVFRTKSRQGTLSPCATAAVEIVFHRHSDGHIRAIAGGEPMEVVMRDSSVVSA